MIVGSLDLGASRVAQLVKNPPALQKTPVRFLGQEDPLEKYGLPTPVFMGFSVDSVSKESTCNARDLDLIPGLGRSPGGGHGNPCLLAWRIPTDRKSLVGYSP